MLFGRLLLFCLIAGPLLYSSPVAILITSFTNDSELHDLDWIGESVSETLITELANADQIVLDRSVRSEGYRRLGLKPQARYTKATLLKLAQTLDADLVCYGTYQVTLPASDAQAREGSIRISARFLDLRKLKDASEFSESGKLTDLSRLEEHLAWQVIHFVDPRSAVTAEALLKPSKLIRLDAKESFIRGLLAPNREQKQKWFETAFKLDQQYTHPIFQLGRLAMQRHDYKQATFWFGKIPPDDTHYLQARFRLGLSAYLSGDYVTAKNSFKDLSGAAPLNEVFNNLGAAESRLGETTAIDNFRHAVDGDASDPIYSYNLALALYRQGDYDAAIRTLKVVLAHTPDDKDAHAVLARCQQRTPASIDAQALPSERLKGTFDLAAFRQLKAVLQGTP